MSTNFRSLQERLRERLLAQIAAGELTGLQLARATGFQQAHISNFLNRKRGLSLEAMDTILAAAKISLDELFAGESNPRSRRGKSEAECLACVAIPIVEAENLIATHVPKQAGLHTILLASSVVQKLPTEMHVPRPHWERFVAVRVTSSDAAAMWPRLARGVIAVIDRHHNSLPERQLGPPPMFLTRIREGFVIRYIERADGKLFARAHNPEIPIEKLEPMSGHDPFSSIIGRLCFLHVQL